MLRRLDISVTILALPRMHAVALITAAHCLGLAALAVTGLRRITPIGAQPTPAAEQPVAAHSLSKPATPWPMAGHDAIRSRQDWNHCNFGDVASVMGWYSFNLGEHRAGSRKGRGGCILAEVMAGQASC